MTRTLGAILRRSAAALRDLARFELSRAVVIDSERAPLGMVTLRDLVLSHVAE